MTVHAATPLPAQLSPTDVRARVHAMWSSVAASWGQHADHVEQRSAGVTRAMIDAVAPSPGDRVLELACGAGGLGLALAGRVRPGGHVLLSDVSGPMVAVAQARVRDSGNGDLVTTAVLDLEQIDQPDKSFDVVVCREGLMFAVEPQRAAREMARVLRPQGRLAVAVWGPRERNPWLGVLAEAVEAQSGVPVPPPGMPGPFALGAPGRLTEVLEAAELEQIQVVELDVPTQDASFDDYWTLRTALAGPLQKRLAALPPHELDAVRERVRAGLKRYASADGLRIPGFAYLASARRG